MSLILNIDTSTGHANVSLSKDGFVLGSVLNNDQKEHASFVQPAIKKIMSLSGHRLQDIDAIAVVSGPGSYTGLRVALASAKGLAYVLHKPLITIGTLHLMAQSALSYSGRQFANFDLVCPMMDARRMEVFTAVFDLTLREVMPPQAMVLKEESFAALLSEHRILFFGSGAGKWKNSMKSTNGLFAAGFDTVQAMADLSQAFFVDKVFTDLAYSEPSYLKEFHTGSS